MAIHKNILTLNAGKKSFYFLVIKTFPKQCSTVYTQQFGFS